METEARRLQDRSPVHVTVDLSGLDIHTAAQQGITENVSARGARVVYCQPLGKDSFAIGLELFVSVGEWTLHQSASRPTD